MLHLPFKRKTHEAAETTHFGAQDREQVLAQLSDIRQQIEILHLERERWTDDVIAGRIDSELYGREMDAIDMSDQVLRKQERALLDLVDKIQADLARTAIRTQ